MALTFRNPRQGYAMTVKKESWVHTSCVTKKKFKERCIPIISVLYFYLFSLIILFTIAKISILFRGIKTMTTDTDYFSYNSAFDFVSC